MLRESLDAMRSAEHTPHSFAEADLRFHLAIGLASGNPLIRSIGGVIEAALVASFSLSSPTDDAAQQEHTVAMHEAIVDAIEAKAPDAARQAMLAVIDAGVQRIAARTRKGGPARPKQARTK